MKKFFVLFLAVIMMTSFLAGCTPNKEEVKIIDLKEVHEVVKEAYGEDYYPNRELTLEEIESFTGLKEEDIESFIAEAPMMSLGVDTLIAIKAVEGKGDIVESGLEKYRTFLVEESIQYPMNIAKVNAAKVIRHGDYAFFLMLGKYDDREEASDEERLEYAKAEVKRAEDVINSFFE
ncbi:MAG: DUF4358 domain-containing protein [Tissierellaceae bacterium]|nr:DUF4358 domain-containing protein [Tissierellaceae bacterium]